MKDTELKAFLAASETGSFSKAAEKLFISVGAVKKQIDQLEQETRFPLFVRSVHGLTLTEEGRQFADYVRTMLNGYQATLDEMNRQYNRQNSFILSCNSTQPMDDHMYDCMPGLLGRYPGTSMKLEFGDLDPERHDAFTGIPEPGLLRDPRVHSHFICWMPIVAYMVRNHPLAAESPCRAEALASGKVILPPAIQLPFIEPLLPASLTASGVSVPAHLNPFNRLFDEDILAGRSVMLTIGPIEGCREPVVARLLEGYRYPFFIYTTERSEQKPFIRDFLETIRSSFAGKKDWIQPGIPTDDETKQES